MLRSLQIRNIAVIKEADIEFGDAFNALTGETGAGKSIVIDSISLLLGGGKSPKDLIRSGEEKASVTALFENAGEKCIEALEKNGFETAEGSVLLKRTISSDGRSSAYINGQIATQSMLRGIGNALITVHGQHDSHMLTRKAFHMRLVDAYAENAETLCAYREYYEKLKDAERELRNLRKDEAEKERRRDTLEYQIKEIEAASLRVGEEEELKAERLRLRNIEKIEKQSNYAYRALYGGEKVSASMLVGRAASALRAVADVIPDADKLASRLDGCKYEIDDIAAAASAYAESDGVNPTEKLDAAESRLDKISRLERKYGRDIGEVLEFGEKAKKELEDLDNADARGGELEKEISALRTETEKTAKILSERRKESALRAEKKILEILSYLDMAGVGFKIDLRDKDLGPDGADEAEFMISANPGEPFVSLAKTASGGELSRVMLALKCVLSENDGADTMIFDEIDSGISGKTSRKVGIKLSEIAKNAQVLCVTHSAQIASLANRHLLVAKEETKGRAETSVRIVSGEERVEEIARILGGISVTEKQRAAARELLASDRSENPGQKTKEQR